MKKIAVFVVVLRFVLIASFPCFAKGKSLKEKQVEKILQLEGLKTRLQQNFKSFSLSLNQIRNIMVLSDKDYALYKKIMLSSFDIQKFCDLAKAYYLRKYNPSAVQLVLEWDDSPLGKKINQAFISSNSQSFESAVERYVKNNPLSKERKALLEQIIASLGVENSVLEGNMTFWRTAIQGVQMIYRPNNPHNPVELKRLMDLEKEKEIKPTKEYADATTFYLLRNFSDDELKLYLAYLNTNAGQWFIHTRTEARNAALNWWSQQTLQKIVQAFQKKEYTK